MVGKVCKYPESYIIEELSKRGFVLLDRYQRKNKKALFRCKFGHTFLSSADLILNRNYGCPHCAGNAPRTEKDIRDALATRGITLIGEYRGMRFSHTFTAKCGHTWKTNVDNILNKGTGCFTCGRIISANKQKKEFEDICVNLLNRNILVLSTSQSYKNNLSHLNVQCTICGHKWNARWNMLQQGTGCRKCVFAGKRGENHHNWRGGTSRSGYTHDWTKSLKTTIRNKDNHVCQYVSINGKDKCDYRDTVDGNQRLHVHHIDGNKENCNEWNLISLCNHHHQIVEHNNPKLWTEIFYQITFKRENEKTCGISDAEVHLFRDTSGLATPRRVLSCVPT